MPARFAVHWLVACCFTLIAGSTAVRAADPPAAPKTLAELEQEYKVLVETKKGEGKYKVLGQIWAADPARIPDALPGLMKVFGNLKAGEFYMRDVLTLAAKHCVQPLIKMLKGDDREQVFQARTGLRIILDEARPALEELLGTGTTDQRFDVIQILGNKRYDNKAAESTVTKLKGVLTDREPKLQVEAALALAALQVNDPQIAQVLEQNFAQHNARILEDALRGGTEAFRGVLTLALNQKENRNWRVEAALQLATLDHKLSKPVQTALIEGLSKQQGDSYRLSEKCIEALALPSEAPQDSIAALARIRESGYETPEFTAAAAASLIQIDPEHAPAYVANLLPIIERPRYRLEKGKYLALLGKLGKQGEVVAKPLHELLSKNDETFDLLLAIVLLKIDPEHPEQTHEFLRAVLAGKKKAGSVGLNHLQDVTLDCAPLLPDLIAAIESDNLERQRAAINLLRDGGATATLAVPALEKKLTTLKDPELEGYRELINHIKAAKP